MEWAARRVLNMSNTGESNQRAHVVNFEKKISRWENVIKMTFLFSFNFTYWVNCHQRLGRAINVYFKKVSLLIWVTYVVGTHWNCLNETIIIPMCTYRICQFNKWVFFTIQFFSQTSQLFFFMFQCNEHVEMNKFLVSLACTWMTII